MTKKLLLCSSARKILPLIKERLAALPKSTKLVAITTAANLYQKNDRPWFDKEIQGIKDLGFDFAELDLTGKTKAEISQILNDVQIIYVSGGSAYHLIEQMRLCNFDEVLSEAMNRGVLYIGSSAGAIVLCPTIDYIGKMDRKDISNMTDFSGLNFVPFRILPHLGNPKYTDLMAELMPKLKQSNDNIIGLKDDQAIFVENEFMEICA